MVTAKPTGTVFVLAPLVVSSNQSPATRWRFALVGTSVSMSPSAELAFAIVTVPMDELLVKRDWKPLIFILAAIIIVGGLGVAGYFLVPRILEARSARLAEREADAEAVSSEPGIVYTLDEEILERRFQERDVVTIPFKDGRYEIILSDIDDEL